MSTLGAHRLTPARPEWFPEDTPNVVWPAGVLVGIMIGWELGVWLLDVPSYVLPAPSAILVAFTTNYLVILGELRITLTAFAVAFGLTVVTGYVFAVCMYEWKTLETTFYPYVIAARAVPIVSLIPIFIIWFGFGFRSIVIISYLISLFAMVVNSLAGFKSTDPEVIEMLNSFSATRWDLFREIHVYASLPLVLAGTKICVILAFTGVIVGEFLIGTEGIGFLILEYNSGFATEAMFAGILTISVTQLALFGVVVLLERRLVTWQ